MAAAVVAAVVTAAAVVDVGDTIQATAEAVAVEVDILYLGLSPSLHQIRFPLLWDQEEMLAHHQVI